MAKVLVVKASFGEYQIGDIIADSALIAKYSETHPANVVTTNLPDSHESVAGAPAPAAGNGEV